MFQTFTGSTRRPRQVNLSGRNHTSSLGLGPGSGSQQALKHAQQEKLARQRQRLEQSAAVDIQRIWRGVVSRRHIRSQWRSQWDHSVSALAISSSPCLQDITTALSRLHLFWDPSHRPDLDRLKSFARGPLNLSLYFQDHPRPEPHIAFRHLEDMCEQALSHNALDLAASPAEADQLLHLLKLAIMIEPDQCPRFSTNFWPVFASMTRAGLRTDMLFDTMCLPLRANTPTSLTTHVEFVNRFLTEPIPSVDLDRIAPAIDGAILTQAFLRVSQTEVSNVSGQDQYNRGLWLLGNLIYLLTPVDLDTSSRKSESRSINLASESAAIVSRLLGRLPPIAPDEPYLDLENDAYQAFLLSSPQYTTPLPLNFFLGWQLQKLHDKATLRSLIAPSVINSSDPPTASTIANYVFPLLRIFPKRADEIRIQLSHLRPRLEDGLPVSVITLLWHGVRQTSLFQRNCQSPFNASHDLANFSGPETGSHSNLHKDFRTILVFLDLYAFILQFVDDEEFLGHSLVGEDSFRSNSLSLSELHVLVDFLKNIGFALYYLSDEIDRAIRTAGREPDLDLVKRLVTSLAKSIHDRDSRRHLFPKDKWLMTTQIDLQGFIKDAMFEEEKRRNPQYDDDDDDLADATHDPNDTTTPSIARRSNFKRPALLQGYQPKAVTPRWHILQNMPFLLPFEARVRIFRDCIEFDQEQRRMGHIDADIWRNAMMYMSQGDPTLLERHHAKVRRKHEFEDAFDQLYGLGEGLKEPMQITFVDEFDIAEAGIDGGGVTKEFLTSATSGALDPDAGLFRSSTKYLLSPDPTSVLAVREMQARMGNNEQSQDYKDAVNHLLKQYEFLGRVIGKCLYEGILVDITFAGFFLLKWAQGDSVTTASKPKPGAGLSLNELRDYDEDLYQGLHYLKTHTSQAEDLGLTFSVASELRLGDGTTKIIEQALIPNGINTPVTKANYTTYITRMARFRLAEQTDLQTRAFLRGLHQIIDPHWLSMFNQSEIQTLIGGAASSIDVSDLRRNTHYGGVYVIGDDGQEHPVVQRFWAVMTEISDAERRKVLKFVTSTPRAPLLGFASLNPRFSIRDSGADQARFPTTSTCVNLLKLPRYETADVLREKLLYAVNSGAGFDLS